MINKQGTSSFFVEMLSPNILFLRFSYNIKETKLFWKRWQIDIRVFLWAGNDILQYDLLP